MRRGAAIVLGASSGIGAATAIAFAQAGHPILGLHFDLRSGHARAEAVRRSCEAAGVPASFVNGNAADLSVRDQALDGLEGPVDVLVHSLAFGTLKPYIADAGAIAPRDMAMTLDVMAHSLVWWVQALVQRDLLRPGARIFALTSVGSVVAMPAYGAVSAAKAALEAHVRQLAVELAPRGVRVNAVMAGVCHTPALEKIPGWERLRAEASRRNPSGRLTTPADVADAIVALAAPGLAWMTGQTVRIDGGETIAAGLGAPEGGAT